MANTKVTEDVLDIGDLTIGDKLIHAGDTDTHLRFPAADDFRIVVGNSTRAAFNTSKIHFNQEGIDQDFHVQGDNESNLLYVDAGNDKIGIGEASPLARLHVKEGDSGQSSINSNFDQLVLEDDAHSGMTILSGNSSDGGIYFGDDGGNNLGQFKYQHGNNNFAFITNNGTTDLRIDSDGIKFNGDAASANGLDDYEQGTWTPQLSDLGGNLATLSTAEGSYTKIGRMVFLHYRVIMSSKGSMTGNYIHLKNIPYNHPTQAYNGTGMVDYFTGLESNVSSLAWDTSSTAGVFWLVGVTATQGTAVSYIPTSYLGGNEQFKGSVIYQTSV